VLVGDSRGETGTTNSRQEPFRQVSRKRPSWSHGLGARARILAGRKRKRISAFPVVEQGSVGRRALPPDAGRAGAWAPADNRTTQREFVPGWVTFGPGPDATFAAHRYRFSAPVGVASLAVDLLAETRRDRRAALEEGISDRLAGASCRTGHCLRRPRRCSCCGGRCVLWWGHGVPTDLARGLLSNPVMSSPMSALGDQPLVGQVAPPNSHRPLAVSGSIFEPCRFVALLTRPGPVVDVRPTVERSRTRTPPGRRTPAYPGTRCAL